METTTANLPETVSLIPLTQSAHAIVDNEDLELLDGYRWSLTARRQLRYARRYVGRKAVYMHREIMNAPAGMQIDHINGNGLDNRKVNLRLCNCSQNQRNARKRKKTTSRFKGVSWNNNRWRARIYFNGEQITIGRFKSELEAAKAYDKKAVELFGEFANPNFPSQKTTLISEKKQNEMVRQAHHPERSRRNARLSEFGNNRYGTDNN